MAISQLCIGNVQTGGLDTNGGFFHAGATGTDYSKQTTPQYSVADGVTAGTTTITSVSANFGTDVVGNGIYVQGGTGSISAGWYEITSRTNSTTIVVDRSTGLSAGTGATLHIGGCWLTIQQGINAMFTTATGYAGTADTELYVKSGTYASTVALVTTNSVAVSGYRNRVIGYNSVYDDNPSPQSGNQPVYAVGSGAGVNGLTISTGGFAFEFLTFDGTATTGTKGATGVSVGATTYHRLFGCKIMNFTNEGYTTPGSTAGYSTMIWSEITGCGGTNGSVVSDALVAYCWIHKNTKTGIYDTANSGKFIYNLVTNNSGASSDGILAGFGSTVIGNTIYGNGRDGIRTNGNVYDLGLMGAIMDNILAKNAGFGLNVVGATPLPLIAPWINYNGYYSNTSGNYSTHTTAGLNDVAVSSNPFVSSDANLASETAPNWGLNNTASAGASFRAVSIPGLFAGLTTTIGYSDIGAVQHQDPASTGTGFIIF